MVQDDMRRNIPAQLAQEAGMTGRQHLDTRLASQLNLQVWSPLCLRKAFGQRDGRRRRRRFRESVTVDEGRHWPQMTANCGGPDSDTRLI
jgi:hypothetical protein